jgi:hypothetical protein
MTRGAGRTYVVLLAAYYSCCHKLRQPALFFTRQHQQPLLYTTSPRRDRAAHAASKQVPLRTQCLRAATRAPPCTRCKLATGCIVGARSLVCCRAVHAGANDSQSCEHSGAANHALLAEWKFERCRQKTLERDGALVGSAKCGLSFAGLHEKSQKSCRPASNSTLQAYSYLLMIKL